MTFITQEMFFAGTLLNYIEIRGIASDPWSANVKQVERFNDISTVVQPVVDAMCDSMRLFITLFTTNNPSHVIDTVRRNVHIILS